MRSKIKKKCKKSESSNFNLNFVLVRPSISNFSLFLFILLFFVIELVLSESVVVNSENSLNVTQLQLTNYENKTNCSDNCDSSIVRVSTTKVGSGTGEDASKVVQKFVNLYKTSIEPILFKSPKELEKLYASSNNTDVESRTFILIPTVLLFQSLSFVGRFVFFSGLTLITVVTTQLLVGTVTFFFTFIFKSIFWTLTSTFWFLFFTGAFLVGGVVIFQVMTGGTMGARSMPQLQLSQLVLPDS